MLGAGWTSTFLCPLLDQENVSYAKTTTSGRDGTLKFKFSYDPAGTILDNPAQYHALPTCRTVLITFPLTGQGQSSHLFTSYVQSHDGNKAEFNFIQLGSSGIFTIPQQDQWITRHSRYDTSNSRGIAEDELKALGGCILNLSGLWGGERQPKNWIGRVAATKEQLASKTSLHLVHGLDVARSILAVHCNFEKAKGERFVSSSVIWCHRWMTEFATHRGYIYWDTFPFANSLLLITLLSASANETSAEKSWDIHLSGRFEVQTLSCVANSGICLGCDFEVSNG